jgi:hypothetical protein
VRYGSLTAKGLCTLVCSVRTPGDALAWTKASLKVDGLLQRSLWRALYSTQSGSSSSLLGLPQVGHAGGFSAAENLNFPENSYNLVDLNLGLNHGDQT